MEYIKMYNIHDIVGDIKGRQMNKAIGYVRVSTEEQAREGVSLAAQEERLRAYCAMAGLELVGILREEGVSGAKPLADRPCGLELLKAVKSKAVQHVVALKLDRLFRDAEDCLHQTKAWDKAGAALHLLDMGGQAINTASPMGRMFLTMAAGFAELERNLISERTKVAMQHLKAQGKTFGHTAFNDTDITSYLKAERAQGRSYRELAAELNSRGIPTAQGGTSWFASSVRSVVLHAA
jgi:DNA invertase Pin-like site-specific DNA recombinase